MSKKEKFRNFSAIIIIFICCYFLPLVNLLADQSRLQKEFNTLDSLNKQLLTNFDQLGTSFVNISKIFMSESCLVAPNTKYIWDSRDKFKFFKPNFNKVNGTQIINTSHIKMQEGWPYSMGIGCEGGVSLSSATYADLDLDGDLEIIVGGRDGNIYALHHNGTEVDGWPFHTRSYVVTSPAIGDINNDGFPEVIVSCNDGYLYALSYNANILDGWPILVDYVHPHSGGAYTQGSPVLADVDGDSYLDIIYNSVKFDKTYIFNYQGQTIKGWPQKFLTGEFTSETPAVADLDHDGKIEVIVGVLFSQDGSPNYNKIYVWHSNGTLMSGWPKKLENHLWSPIWSIAIGDMNSDGDLDIVAVDLINVYILNKNGDILEGWPFEVKADLSGHSLALANFDEDIHPEIVVNSRDKIYLLDDNGIIMNGFPIIMNEPTQIAVADIDLDNKNEIICGNGYPSNSLYAWNDDGSLVDDFPLQTNGFINSTPLILDLDNDGDVEICIGEYSSQIVALYFYVWDSDSPYNPSLIEWPMFQHDPQHTGRYESITTSMATNNYHYQLPKEFFLGQNYPNPFNPETSISYQVPKTSHIKIEVFNLLGQQIRTLVDEEKAPGSYQILWNGLDNQGQPVSTGVYLYKMHAGDFTAMKKMVLVR